MVSTLVTLDKMQCIITWMSKRTFVANENDSEVLIGIAVTLLQP